MLNLNPKNLSKITTIPIIVLLILTILSSILFSVNINTDENKETLGEEVATQVDAERDITHENIIAKECTIFQTTDYFEFAPSYDQPQALQGTRNRAQYDYDLRIKTVNITYSGLTPWVVTIDSKNYYYFIAGGIDERTFFTITLENIGNRDISSSENVLFKINLTDHYGYTSWEQQEY